MKKININTAINNLRSKRHALLEEDPALNPKAKAEKDEFGLDMDSIGADTDTATNTADTDDLGLDAAGYDPMKMDTMGGTDSMGMDGGADPFAAAGLGGEPAEPTAADDEADKKIKRIQLFKELQELQHLIGRTQDLYGREMSYLSQTSPEEDLQGKINKANSILEMLENARTLIEEYLAEKYNDALYADNLEAYKTFRDTIEALANDLPEFE